VKRSIFLFLFLFSYGCAAQAALQGSHTDLKDQWLVYRSGALAHFDNESSTSIFFWVDQKKEKGNHLIIEGNHTFTVFVNSKLLLQQQGKVRLSIDSLSKIYSHQLFIGIFAMHGVHQLQTTIERNHLSDQPEAVLRKGNYFLDFSVLASFILIVCFVFFLRTNPALTFDYLDMNKLFSLQDRDESTLTLRIASSVNLLIYLFGSFFFGLMLLISLHLMGDQVSLSHTFPVHSTTQGFLQWLLLSLIIFGLLLIKLLWLVLLTAVFGFRDTVNFQFFNFVRVMLVSVCLIATIAVFYFILGVQQQAYFFHLLTVLSIVFIGGTAITYFKLLARMPFHFFHLFSYLCAAEIIPLLVLMKVFFY
jgi:hypothetical protein